MGQLAELFWNLLSVAGGSLALGFIVAIALAIGAITLLFFGSSVVVLERFARAANRPKQTVAVALCWALLVGSVGVLIASPEARMAGESAGLLWRNWLSGAYAGVFLCLGLVWLALRYLRPRGIAMAGLVWMGIAYTLWIGGTAQAGFAAIPALLMGAIWLTLRLLRARKGTGTYRSFEAPLICFALALLPGIPLALGLGGEPAQGASEYGLLLFAVFAALLLLGVIPLAIAGLLEMRGSVEWFIAVRYLVAKRRQTFISLITMICVGGVAAGVWLIIIVLSVMNGFEQTWREEIIGNRAHLTVHSGIGPFADYDAILAQVEGFPEVVGASPFLDAEGMVRGEAGRIVGVRIRGIDPARIGRVTDLEADLVEGSLEPLSDPESGTDEGEEEGADPHIILGSKLAASLGVRVGDPLVLISPFGGAPTPMGPAPRLERFQVAGIFESSFFQYDEVYTYVSIPAVQDFLRVEDVIQGIEVRVTDFYRSKRVGRALARELGFPFFARDWKEFYPAFFQALKTERMMMFFLLTMIMVVAAFVIVATLVMMIMEKSSDIAILKTMGAEDLTIERIFAIEGVLIGLAGTVVGVLAGIIVTTKLPWIQAQIEAITGIDTLPASVYQLSTIPWHIDPAQVLGVAAIAMVLSLGATLLPSRQGAQLDPAEALRYE